MGGGRENGVGGGGENGVGAGRENGVGGGRGILSVCGRAYTILGLEHIFLSPSLPLCVSREAARTGVQLCATERERDTDTQTQTDTDTDTTRTEQATRNRILHHTLLSQL